MSVTVRSFFPFLMLLLLGGCASTHSPASLAARTPTPESVTRDNPGGDAEFPIDAAVARLVEQPIGHKHDKFSTLNVPFADAKNWKRIRFFGYPTRAGFRYGKNRYALGVIDYADAPDDDSPIGCLERFVERGSGIAELFDVQVGEFQRSLSQHYRGVEAVDWVERDKREAAQEIKERKRRARMKRLRVLRSAKLRKLAEARRKDPAYQKKLAEARARAEARRNDPENQKKLAERRARAEALRKKRRAEAEARRNDPEYQKKLAERRARAEALRKDPAYQKKLAEMRARAEARRKDPKYQKKLAERRARARAMRAAEREAAKEEDKGGILSWFAPVTKEGEEARRKKRLKAARRRAAIRRAKARRRRNRKPEPRYYGKADMPVLQTTGEVVTLLQNERYMGAVVAYRSWPGTCLVQGFAVRVGTDDELAEQALARWLDEMAPKLAWRRRIHEQPEIKNR